MNCGAVIFCLIRTHTIWVSLPTINSFSFFVIPKFIPRHILIQIILLFIFHLIIQTDLLIVYFFLLNRKILCPLFYDNLQFPLITFYPYCFSLHFFISLNIKKNIILLKNMFLITKLKKKMTGPISRPTTKRSSIILQINLRMR